VNCISSDWVAWHKKVLPFIYAFAFLAILAWLFAKGSPSEPLVLLFVLAIPVPFALGYWFTVRTLADSVHDGGDHLLIERRGVQSRVFLREIERVALHASANPPRITLHLCRRLEEFGTKVAFVPGGGIQLFGNNAVAEDLSRRVRALRVVRS
jgi:hypothetical protein